MRKGYLYLLQSTKDQSLYFGSTVNIDRRLAEHNAGKSSSTRSRRPWTMKHIIEIDTILGARKKEQYMKAQKRRCTEAWFLEQTRNT